MQKCRTNVCCSNKPVQALKQMHHLTYHLSAKVVLDHQRQAHREIFPQGSGLSVQLFKNLPAFARIGSDSPYIIFISKWPSSCVFFLWWTYRDKIVVDTRVHHAVNLSGLLAFCEIHANFSWQYKCAVHYIFSHFIMLKPYAKVKKKLEFRIFWKLLRSYPMTLEI